jgi:PD-(D/E)XK nuclease superfamily
VNESKPIRNEFSWSKSRHEKFVECARAYFFHYYQSWGGWDDAAPAQARELYFLKKLSNRFTWAGSAVHGAIQQALMRLKSGAPVDLNRAIESVHRQMRDDFADSRAKKGRTTRIRKGFHGLVEHEYDEPVDDSLWLQNWLNVRQGLEWFFSSSWPDNAKALHPDAWLEVDVMDFERSIFFLDDVKIFAVPDFAFRGRDGIVHIVDWKTGLPRDGYDDQVLGYALYLHHRYQIALSDMRATLVYVNSGSEKSFAIESAAIDSFVERFRVSSRSMKALLADVQENTPLSEESFPKTSDLTKCARCVFRRPCGREAAVRDAV